MTPSSKKTSNQPRIGEVRLLFRGRVAYVQISGSQGRIESVTVYQEVADQLVAGGINAFLLDIRDASYPPSQVAEIVARVEWLGRTYPPGRAALWHKGEDPYVVSQLIGALKRSGHDAVGIRKAMQARRALVPREGSKAGDGEVWLIDDDPRSATGTR